MVAFAGFYMRVLFFRYSSDFVKQTPLINVISCKRRDIRMHSSLMSKHYTVSLSTKGTVECNMQMGEKISPKPCFCYLLLARIQLLVTLCSTNRCKLLRVADRYDCAVS